MICPNCGLERPDEGFCPNCGAPPPASASTIVHVDTEAVEASGYEHFLPFSEIRRRSVVGGIVLSIITLGIYSFYWLFCLNNDIRIIAGNGKPKGLNSYVVVLLSIVTLHFFTLFWLYHWGHVLDDAGARYGWTPDNHSLLYLSFGLVWLDFISFALVQRAVNQYAPMRRWGTGW